MQSLNERRGRRKKQTGKRGKILPIILLLLIIVGGLVAAKMFFENVKPRLVFDEKLQFLGKTTDFTFSVKDAESGLRSVRLVILQGTKEVVLYEKLYPRTGYTGQIGPVAESQKVHFDFTQSDLEEGEAEIILSAADYSSRGYLKGNYTELRKTVTIDTIPPKIRPIHSERYIFPGGSGIVIYQLSGSASYHGAEVGGHFHGGHPVGDGRDNVFIAYIALPYDANNIGSSKIYAVDEAGNSTMVPFSPVMKKPNFKFDRIDVSDGFLNAKIPEFELHYPQMSGSMKDKYLFANSAVRLENNQKIFDLCQNPTPERLWQGRFLRMAGASRAGYADHRTYFYQNKEIDKQVHLGMDIASTRRAEVKAANRGKVIYADYLGIYGNMVVLDHGQGVFSLYSHLSQIEVAVNDTIESGTVLGLTGKTGMAGGDHLHFSMLVNGIFVTPKEWWDPQWIEVTIEAPLADSRF